MPPGYQVDLDRLPPTSQSGCGRVLALGLLGITLIVMMCAGAVFLVTKATAKPPTPTVANLPTENALAPLVVSNTATFTAIPTIDNWSATGTALFFATAQITPTVDYCWFLTPSPIPSNTPVPVTPDEWALQGTQIALSTGTPTLTPFPTQAPPRAWCDAQTATLTPFTLPTIDANGPTATASQTPTETATATATKPLPPTAFPPIQEVQPQTQYIPPAQPTPAPVIIIQTSAPVVVTVIQVVTPVPSRTPTLTPTATATPTETPTSTPTATETLIPTMEVIS